MPQEFDAKPWSEHRWFWGSNMIKLSVGGILLTNSIIFQRGGPGRKQDLQRAVSIHRSGRGSKGMETHGKLMWKWVWAWLHWESDLSDLRMDLEWNALNMFKHWLFCIAVEGRPVCARGKFVCSLNIARRSTGGWLFHTMVYVHPTGGCCLWLWWWCWWWRRRWWWYTWYSTVVSGAGWLEQQSAFLFPWGHFYSWGAAQEGAQGYPGGWWNLNGSIRCLNISQPSIRYCDVLWIVRILLQLLKLITFGGEADIPIGGSQGTVSPWIAFWIYYHPVYFHTILNIAVPLYPHCSMASEFPTSVLNIFLQTSTDIVYCFSFLTSSFSIFCHFRYLGT